MCRGRERDERERESAGQFGGELNVQSGEKGGGGGGALIWVRRDGLCMGYKEVVLGCVCGGKCCIKRWNVYMEA